MSDKLLIRVLQSVEAGYDTSAMIAELLHAHRVQVAQRLQDLFGYGLVSRERVLNRRQGRPHFRYTFISLPKR